MDYVAFRAYYVHSICFFTILTLIGRLVSIVQSNTPLEYSPLRPARMFLESYTQDLRT